MYYNRLEPHTLSPPSSWLIFHKKIYAHKKTGSTGDIIRHNPVGIQTCHSLCETKPDKALTISVSFGNHICEAQWALI